MLGKSLDSVTLKVCSNLSDTVIVDGLLAIGVYIHRINKAEYDTCFYCKSHILATVNLQCAQVNYFDFLILLSASIAYCSLCCKPFYAMYGM